MRLRTLLVYAAMIAGTVGAFLAVRALGASLVAPPPPSAAGFRPPAGAAGDALLHVLLALVAIVLVARLLGALFKKLQQPPVIGEVVAGILLGPSLLGRIAPDAKAWLLPAAVAPYLGVIAQVGVIIYMFLVGLELDTRQLREKAGASVAISHASIITPFLLGSGFALWLYPRYASAGVPFTVFALFMGISLSVTAFPVLARILSDRKLDKSRLGVIALACAAVDDVTAWCLLAFVTSVAQAEPGRVVLTVALTTAFIALVFFAVRPAARWLVKRHETGKLSPPTSMAVVCVGLLVAALATEAIGIHALFGAFLVGAVIPHDSALARDVTQRLKDVVVVLLLPAFFAFSGLRTEIGLVTGAGDWAVVGLIILIASAGKFGGSALAARLSGLDARQSMSLGILMNTRGLMELIVLNVGLDLGVLSPRLFAMLVVMALVTTIATTPVLHLLNRDSRDASRSFALKNP